MRIVAVEVIPVQAAVPAGAVYWGNQSWGRNKAASDAAAGLPPGDDFSSYPARWRRRAVYSKTVDTTIIRIETDDGLVGYGEAKAPVAPGVTAAIVREIFADLLVGEDPTRPGFHWERLYGAMRIRGHAAGFGMTPPIPEREVVVNEGDSVGIYSHFSRRLGDPQPMHASERSVPAWRISQVGLTPEASTTHLGNPAVLLTHYAAYMLRLASYTGERFFRDIARSAVVGRYMNYPGYDINGEFATVYQQADYPLRPLEQLTYNQIYYNHVWPHITLLMDYLISDAVTRSEGEIDFPSRYAQGYAYLQSKVYGDRPGTFYGEKDVRLWMPTGLLRTNSIQVNYVAAYGNDNLYLGLLNQSNEAIDVTVTLNPEVVPVDTGRVYEVRVWEENAPATPATLRRGAVTVSLASKGITALAIEGLAVTPQFQREVFDTNTKPLSDQSYATVESPFGDITGMITSFGRSLTSGYVWLEATEEDISAARLHYEHAGEENVLIDEEYPYEFSLPLSERGAFSYYVEGVQTEGTTVRSKEVTLDQ